MNDHKKALSFTLRYYELRKHFHLNKKTEIELTNELGRRYMNVGDNPNAGIYFSQTLALEPNHGFASGGLGIVKKLSAKYDEAYQLLKFGLEKDKSLWQPDYVYHMGDCLQRVHKNKEVKNKFNFNSIQFNSIN